MELFYRKYGKGQDVIILHGLFGLSDNWVTFGKKIAENNFCVYIPDQRNHGNSPHSDEFNYDILSEDLKNFIERHSIEKSIIIGHSMGGKVAMNFALNYPEKILKLIIVDIGIKKYPVRDFEIINTLSKIDLKSASSRQEIEKQILLKNSDQKILQLILKNLKRVEGNKFEWKFNIDGIKKNFNSIFESIYNNKLPFTEQSLFISGEFSDYINENDIPEIYKLFPSAIYKKISGASHWVHVDKPKELINLVLKFIIKK